MADSKPIQGENFDIKENFEAPTEGKTVLTPNVNIENIEDFKKVLIRNNETGEVYTAYDKLMMNMGIAVAKDVQKQEEHRKQTMDDIKRGG